MDRRSYNNLPDYWSHVFESNSHSDSLNDSKTIEPQRPICPNTLSAYFLEEPSSNSLSFQPSYALPGSGLSNIHTRNPPMDFFSPSTSIYHEPSMVDLASETNMMSAPLAFPHLVSDTSRTLATCAASELSITNDRPKKLE
ncbi:hypothetical protein N7513_000152 [Penicillium frequentans]|nr:hypothetical protein N7513_000152 [Penicillium glabrum]